METLIIIAICIFLLDKLIQFITSILSPQKKISNVLDNDPAVYMDMINTFIRREASFEILKWITETKNIKSAKTRNSTFVSQLTNGEEIKKRTAAITSIISAKMSSDIRGAFNRIYKKDIEKADKGTFVDINLQEYISRYVFFLLRRISYDITILINEYTDKNIGHILNIYLVGLEETIYKENKIFLINNNNSNLSESNTTELQK